MNKTETKAVRPPRPPHPTDASGCVVCGQYTGELSESAGVARWHKACEATHPAVVAKVKARALNRKAEGTWRARIHIQTGST